MAKRNIFYVYFGLLQHMLLHYRHNGFHCQISLLPKTFICLLDNIFLANFYVITYKSFFGCSSLVGFVFLNFAAAITPIHPLKSFKLTCDYKYICTDSNIRNVKPKMINVLPKHLITSQYHDVSQFNSYN